MQYDQFFIFQLPEGVKTGTINRYLKSEAYQKFLKAQGPASDAEQEALPPLPDRYINTRADLEALKHLVFREYLHTLPKRYKKSKQADAYLAQQTLKLPPSLHERFDDMFRAQGSPGVLPMRYVGIPSHVPTLAFILERLKERRVALFEPSFPRVFDGEQARDFIDVSLEEEEKDFEEIFKYMEAHPDWFLTLNRVAEQEIAKNKK